MAKVLCVLYDDPVNGYPKTYARDDVAQPSIYPDAVSYTHLTLPTNREV